MTKSGLTYRESGVDMDAAEELVRAIAPAAKATARAGAAAAIGGFGGIFDLKEAGFSDPLLISGADGVGSKLEIACATGDFSGIGIDLVAMCANDVLVHGAEPLFFLDYIATGHLDTKHCAQLVNSIADGCREAGCALIGGETAEIPGIYAPGQYELAGFCVGAVERRQLLPSKVQEGDIALGLTSSGAHSNGFSLIRKLVVQEGLEWQVSAPFAKDRSLAAELLMPTRIYARQCLELARGNLVRAFSHITGGGLSDNIPRVLDSGLALAIDLSSWPRPPIFGWLQQSGDISQAEMLRTFNCGVGMVAICAPENEQEARLVLEKHGEEVFSLGRVIKRNGPAVVYKGSL